FTPQETLPSPGVGIRHYAPRARVILIEAPLADLPQRLAAAAADHPRERIGLMLPAEVAPHLIAENFAVIYPWGNWTAPEELARNLYSGMRELDAQGCAVILCPLPPDGGVGAAIRDRLRKAAHE